METTRTLAEHMGADDPRDVGPVTGFADAFSWIRRKRPKIGIDHQVDEKAVRGVFANGMKITPDIVDEREGHSPPGLQSLDDGTLGFFAGKQRIVEPETVKQRPANRGVARRHGRQENDVRLAREFGQRLDRKLRRHLPLRLPQEELLLQGGDQIVRS